MTKEELILRHYALHLSCLHDSSDAADVQFNDKCRQAALDIATEDANFIERNHPELFEHVQYSITTLAGNPIKPATPPAVDGGESSQSFKDSITEASRQILVAAHLHDKDFARIYIEARIRLMTKVVDNFPTDRICEYVQAPDGGLLKTMIHGAEQKAAARDCKDLAAMALHILLQRHHAADPIRNIPAFSMAIMNRIVSMLVKKNHDYGNSFGDQLAEDGPIVFKIRMKDKVSRLRTLLTTEAQVKDESIEDTLRDIIGYCILFLHHTAN